MVVATAMATHPVTARRFTSRLGRRRIVDLVVIAATLTVGFVFLAAVITETGPPPGEVVVQAVVGVSATLLLWWRRRWPLAVALLMVPLSFLSSMVQIAGLVAVFTVAVCCRAGVAVAAAAAFWLPTLILHALASDSGQSYLAAVLFSATLAAAAMGWGMFVRARHQLLASLTERAQRAEDEQHERVTRAQQAERTRIAREMHDILGHRLSLLGMHAGALEYRPDASPAELAAAAGTVREQAGLALRDLRQIVGVLREDSDEPTTPQPTLADLPALVAESTVAGLRVDAASRRDRPAEPDRPARVPDHPRGAHQRPPTRPRRDRRAAGRGRCSARGQHHDDQPGRGRVAQRRSGERTRRHGRARPPGRWTAGTRHEYRGDLHAHRMAPLVDMTAEDRRRAKVGAASTRPFIVRSAESRRAGVAPPLIHVVIADDDPLVRSALRMVLAGTDDVTVVAEIADGDEVAQAITEHQPDVVLMDIRMPRLDGVRATEIARSLPRAPDVIVLTTFDADDHVISALRAGASGFLLKDTPPADIVDAIRRVAAGEPILSAGVTRRLIALAVDGRTDTRASEMARQQLNRLSDREREVAEAVSRGLSNAEIADELYMSVATVKSYVTRLLAKLDLNNRVQIAILVNQLR